MTKTEQELKEKIDKVIAEILRDVSGMPACIYFTDRILDIIKEALPELARKAGYEQGCEDTGNKLEQFLLKWKQAGMQEVVDWVTVHNLQPKIHAKESTPSEDCPLCQWQSFLKKHGLENEKERAK